MIAHVRLSKFVTNSNPPFDIEKLTTADGDSDLVKLVVMTEDLSIKRNQNLNQVAHLTLK